MPDLSRSARSASLLVGIVLLFTAASRTPRRADVPLSSLDLTKMKVQPGGGRGGAQTVAQANKSIDGNPIHIGGKEFTAGVGTRANSVLFVQVNGGAEHFSAMVGADDNPIQAPPGAAGQPPAPPPATPIVFRAVGDGRVLHVSKPVSRGDAPEPFDVDVRGIRTLVLQVTQVDVVRPVAANWADARFTVTGAAPVAIDIPVEPREILTPKPGPAPRINGPSLTGVT
ncbi:MAG TPA: NPCBM/NEW2 domain-containing protein, partial [Gemmatimonadaceae bacterium]